MQALALLRYKLGLAPCVPDPQGSERCLSVVGGGDRDTERQGETETDKKRTAENHTRTENMRPPVATLDYAGWRRESQPPQTPLCHSSVQPKTVFIFQNPEGFQGFQESQ